MPDNPKPMDAQEQADIQSVREWCRASHVEDADAHIAFISGRGVFDVSANGWKLNEFLRRYHLETRCHRNSFVGLCGSRIVHMAFKTQSIN